LKRKLLDAPLLALTASLLLAVACLLVCPPEAAAQKRPVKKKPASTKKRTPSRSEEESAPAPVSLNLEAMQVAEQIKVISRFLFVYGKVTNSLEIAEEEAQRGELSAAAAARNRQHKETVVNNIKGLRAGIENVVARFQANPRLQVQYLKIAYAVEAMANAERFATSDRFDEAGKSLVVAIERLTEVMLVLR
jgi:hypothetical protein